MIKSFQGIAKTGFMGVPSRSFSSSSFQPAKLPDLEYDYGELEPVISAEIMQLHHAKHHNTYVTNYNKAVEEFLDASAKGDATKIASLQSAIRFNGGGYINHSIFWTNLTPIKKGGGVLPGAESKLSQQVLRDFGSYENLIAEMTKRTVGVQGSGWGWLGYNKTTKSLAIQEMPNQDPLIQVGLTPLLGIDVWEHAYYLQYKNVRPDYVNHIWKVVNWKNVEERFLASL